MKVLVPWDSQLGAYNDIAVVGAYTLKTQSDDLLVRNFSSNVFSATFLSGLLTLFAVDFRSDFVFHDEFDAKIISALSQLDKPIEMMLPISEKPNKSTYCMENQAEKWTRVNKKCKDSDEKNVMSCCVDNFGSFAVQKFTRGFGITK